MGLLHKQIKIAREIHVALLHDAIDRNAPMQDIIDDLLVQWGRGAKQELKYKEQYDSYFGNKDNAFKQIKVRRKTHALLSMEAIRRDTNTQELINRILFKWSDDNDNCNSKDR